MHTTKQHIDNHTEQQHKTRKTHIVGSAAEIPPCKLFGGKPPPLTSHGKLTGNNKNIRITQQYINNDNERQHEASHKNAYTRRLAASSIVIIIIISSSIMFIMLIMLYYD